MHLPVIELDGGRSTIHTWTRATTLFDYVCYSATVSYDLRAMHFASNVTIEKTNKDSLAPADPAEYVGTKMKGEKPGSHTMFVNVVTCDENCNTREFIEGNNNCIDSQPFKCVNTITINEDALIKHISTCTICNRDYH